MLERLKNRLQGYGEAVIKNGDQEIRVLGLSKGDDGPHPMHFVRTKSSKKLHLETNEYKPDFYALCGRWFEGTTLVHTIPNSRDYFKAPGSRVAWAQEQVPGYELCKGCFFERD